MKTLAFREIKPLGWAVPPEWEGVSELAPACRISYQGDRCSDHTYSLHQYLPGLFSHLQDSAEKVRRVLKRSGGLFKGLERWKMSHTDTVHPHSSLRSVPPPWLMLFSRQVVSDSMDCSPPGSSVHGISQAEILEWTAISFSRGSSRPRD